MSVPPRDRFEFWVRFGCSFLFFGFLLALLSLRFLDGLGLPLGATAWFFTTSMISCYAAFEGDEAWLKIVNFLRWW